MYALANRYFYSINTVSCDYGLAEVGLQLNDLLRNSICIIHYLDSRIPLFVNNRNEFQLQSINPCDEWKYLKWKFLIFLRTQFQITKKLETNCTSITLHTWTPNLFERRSESVLDGGLSVASKIRCMCCPFDRVDSIENSAVNFQTTCIHTPTKQFRFSGSHWRFYSLDFGNTQSVIKLDCKYTSITLHERATTHAHTHTSREAEWQQQMVALLWHRQYSYVQSSLTLSIPIESVRRTGQSF